MLYENPVLFNKHNLQSFVVLKGRKSKLFSFLKYSLDLKSIFTNGPLFRIEGSLVLTAQGATLCVLCSHSSLISTDLPTAVLLQFTPLPHPYPHLCDSLGLEYSRAQRGLLSSWQELPAPVNRLPLTPQECSWHPAPSQALKVNTVNYTTKQRIPDLTQGI